jgi:fused signal recognition particle receptor
MFKFFKDKLKNAVSKLSKKVDEEAPEEQVEVTKTVKVDKKPAPKKSVANNPDSKKSTSKKAEPKKAVKKKPAEKKSETKKVKPKKSILTNESTSKKAKSPITSKDKEVKPEVQEVKALEKPAPKKKGFWSRIKGVVSKKEEPVKEVEITELAGTTVSIDESLTQEADAEEIDELVEETVTQSVDVDHDPSPVIEEIIESPEPSKIEESVKEESGGFFSKITKRITTKKINAQMFDDLFWDIEIVMLENNVAVEVIEKIKEDLKVELVDKPLPRSKIEQTIISTLQKSVKDLFDVPAIDLLKESESKSPLIVCLVGINGSGKTTSIAKLAHHLKKNGKSVVLAAADTFRAAAIDQLQLHADKLGVKLIKHDYGADAAAVAFDAINHAKAKGVDIVLIDTAGRLHSNSNLVDEMKKIIRIAKPDFNIFVGESITGNDCVEQAGKFDEAIGLHGIILSKADIDEKGGAAISVSYVTKKPILYLGTGQEYDDLVEFNADDMIAKLFG